VSVLDVFRVNIIAVPDVIVNNSDFQWGSDSIRSNCYNLRLDSGCNLGKDLRKDRDGVQLVKCKDYRVVSTLYTNSP